MKLLILVLLITIPTYSLGDRLKERLKSVQKSQDQLLQKEVPKQMPLIPIEEPKTVEVPMTETEVPRHVIGDKVTRLEVQLQYMQRDLDKTMTTLQETRDVLIEVVTTLEKASKVTEVQNDKTDKAALWLNIILGIVSVLAGGGGVFAWKNKHLAFKKAATVDDLKGTKS